MQVYNSIKLKLILIYFFTINFLISSIVVYGQEDAFIYSGKILDEDFQPIGGAYIKNMRTDKFAITDTVGQFSIPCAQEDSLIISAMGYALKIVLIDPQTPLITILKRLYFQLDEVIVFEFKEWEAFKEAFLELDLPKQEVNVSGLPAPTRINPIPIKYRSDHFTRGKPHPLNYVLNPASAINYWTNNNEKQKRIMLQKLNQEKKERVYWQVMQQDSIQSFIPIKDPLCADFIVYCNQKIENKTLNKSYYYKAQVLALYEEFKIDQID